jgi:hypothetical protein
MSAFGDAYCPLLVSSDLRALGIFEKGVRQGIDLTIPIRLFPCVTAELFNEYIKTIFIPTVEHKHELPGCDNRATIFFCDNCSRHCSDDISKALAEHGILVIPYPPHTSQIFQVIHSLLFGRSKAAK